MHAGQRASGGRIDVQNCGVRVLTAYESHVQNAGHPDVVDKTPPSQKQRSIFQAPKARTDPAVPARVYFYGQ
jgi:hypothetical protein